MTKNNVVSRIVMRSGEYKISVDEDTAPREFRRGKPELKKGKQRILLERQGAHYTFVDVNRRLRVGRRKISGANSGSSSKKSASTS